MEATGGNSDCPSAWSKCMASLCDSSKRQGAQGKANGEDVDSWLGRLASALP